MNFNQRNIFLLDGLGAMLSALLTGVVLPLVADWVGLPGSTLFSLGVVACIFSIYSLSCYRLVKEVKPFLLIAIIIANSLYCFLSLYIALTTLEITRLGQLYFVLEAIVIAAIISLEIRVYQKVFGK